MSLRRSTMNKTRTPGTTGRQATSLAGPRPIEHSAHPALAADPTGPRRGRRSQRVALSVRPGAATTSTAMRPRSAASPSTRTGPPAGGDRGPARRGHRIPPTWSCRTADTSPLCTYPPGYSGGRTVHNTPGHSSQEDPMNAIETIVQLAATRRRSRRPRRTGRPRLRRPHRDRRRRRLPHQARRRAAIPQDPRSLQPQLRPTRLADRPVSEPAPPVQRGRRGRR